MNLENMMSATLVGKLVSSVVKKETPKPKSTIQTPEKGATLDRLIDKQTDRHARERFYTRQTQTVRQTDRHAR